MGQEEDDFPFPQGDRVEGGSNPTTEFIQRSQRKSKKRRRENTAKFQFDDPFAPASAVLRATPSHVAEERSERLVVYGGDVFELINEALFAASELGLPAVLYTNHSGIRIIEEPAALYEKLERVLPRIKEQSPEWVALAVYAQIVRLSVLKRPSDLREKLMTIVGGLAAQYASMVHNKEHATRGRRVQSGGKKGSELRKGQIADLDRRCEAMHRLIAEGRNVSEAARIVKQRFKLKVGVDALRKGYRKYQKKLGTPS